MSKNFAMLIATNKLGNYLSRERYNLDKMRDNPRVGQSLFETKVGHYNELVDILNDLLGTLADSPTSQLFTRYALSGEDVEEAVEYLPPSYSDEPIETVIVTPAPQPHFDKRAEVAATAEGVTHEERMNVANRSIAPGSTKPDEQQVETESEEQQQWQLDGYTSYDDWVEDKERSSDRLSNDISTGVDMELSMHRADAALNEYERTSERDVATYLPEDDKPVDVLPSEMDSQESESDDADVYERPTQNTDYLTHTVDNVRVNNDPIQIAGVQTAVEREGEKAHHGADINVASFFYQPDESSVTDLIGDDMKRLRVTKTDESVDDQEDAQDSVDDENIDYGDDSSLDSDEPGSESGDFDDVDEQTSFDESNESDEQQEYVENYDGSEDIGSFDEDRND